MAHEHRRGVEVIHRQVEEPLQLVLMEIHRQHPVGARHRDHVGHQLGADRHPRLVLPVLPGVPEIRNHRRHPSRARPPGRVHQEQQLDHVLGRRVGGLDDVDVPAAHVLVDLDEQLAVGKPPERDLAQRLPKCAATSSARGRLADPLRSSIWLRDSDRSVISEPANLAGYRRLRQRSPCRPARWVSRAGVWSARYSCGRRAPVAVLIGHPSYDIVTRLIANFCSVVGVDARRVAWLSLPPPPGATMRPLHIPDSQMRLDHHYAIVPSNCLFHGGAFTRGRRLRRRRQRRWS